MLKKLLDRMFVILIQDVKHIQNNDTKYNRIRFANDVYFVSKIADKGDTYQSIVDRVMNANSIKLTKYIKHMNRMKMAINVTFVIKHIL